MTTGRINQVAIGGGALARPKQSDPSGDALEHIRVLSQIDWPKQKRWLRRAERAVLAGPN